MKTTIHNNWPGIQSLEGPLTISNWPGLLGRPNYFLRDSDWNPTGLGPGEGPDLSCPAETYACPTYSELWTRSEAVLQDEDDSISAAPEVKQAGQILRLKPGHLCPNCGFARLKVDADLHVSCPICSYGGVHPCAR